MYTRPAHSYSVTYGVVDPDNVDEDGELIPEESESGFVVDGLDIELPSDVFGEAAGTFMQTHGVDSVVNPDDWDDFDPTDRSTWGEARCRSMAHYILAGGWTEPNGTRDVDSYSWADSKRDLYTGHERTESIHLHGWTPEELDRIYRLVEAGDPRAE